MHIRWKLRIAAAQREVWTGTELRRLLSERGALDLSSASVSALFTKEPSQIKLGTLLALCAALECTPNDLFDIDTAAEIGDITSRSEAASPPPVARAAGGRSMPPL